MFRFNWKDLVTPDLITEIVESCHEVSEDDKEVVRKSVLLTLKKLGGFPISPRELNTNECHSLVRHLLNQPILRHLTGPYSPYSPPLYVTNRTNVGLLRKAIQSVDAIELNSATTSDLEGKAGVGAALARDIVRERESQGPFTSLENLATRVKGLSSAQKKKLRRLVSFRRSTYESSAFNGPALSQTFGELVRDIERSRTRTVRSVDEHKGEQAARRMSAVKTAAAAILRASSRPIEWRDQLIGAGDVNSSKGSVRAEWVGFLEDRQYYKLLPSIIDLADRSIMLCMFHIVFSSERHPTRKLLDALVAAKERGVTIKVIVDQDRKNDPYHSLVINTPARKFFEKNGIECRFDQTDRLLHSKYLVIDDDKVVIGSHNWSAGSYFNYKDLSFLVYSKDFAKQLSARFEKQWAISSNNTVASSKDNQAKGTRPKRTEQPQTDTSHSTI